MKRAEEEFCKEAFTEFLNSRPRGQPVAWKEVSQNAEPPDYYLQIGNAKYAVEVTTLMGKVKVGSRQIPSAGVRAPHWSLIAGVETRARDEEYLSGSYVVGFHGPIEELSKEAAGIEQRLLLYIALTQDKDSAQMESVFERGNSSCTIRKVARSPDRIVKTGPTSIKWEDQIAREAREILWGRLDEKRKKLKGVPEPTILLLYAAYHFADREMYLRCRDEVAAATAFHTVFIVRGNSEENFVLTSVDPDWMKGVA